MSQKLIRSIPELHSLYRSLSIKPTTFIRQCYERAVKEKSYYNSYIYINGLDELLAAASASQERYSANKQLSAIDGVPVSIKANIAVKGMPHDACSDMLSGYTAQYDATVVQRLKDCGAIVLGITNMDEFGMGSLGTNSKYGPVRNCIPSCGDILKNNYYSPGGSSSGAAVSVSFGSVLAAIGSDTGGSIRLPAAWCNVVGVKPSYGLIPRHGLISYASSLDTVGVITNEVDCAASVLACVAGADTVRDSTSLSFEGTNYLPKRRDGLNGVKIGIPCAFNVNECPDEIRYAWEKSAEQLKTVGADIVVVEENLLDGESIRDSLAAYYILACAEASSNLARYDGIRYGQNAAKSILSEVELEKIQLENEMNLLQAQYSASRSLFFGKEVRKRIMCGSVVLSSDYVQSYYDSASKLRQELKGKFEQTFKQVDLLLTPTAMQFPQKISPNSTSETDTGNEVFLNDILTVPVSLAGLPALSSPVIIKDDIFIKEKKANFLFGSVGMQLIGPCASESLLFDCSRYLK